MFVLLFMFFLWWLRVRPSEDYIYCDESTALTMQMVSKNASNASSITRNPNSLARASPPKYLAETETISSLTTSKSFSRNLRSFFLSSQNNNCCLTSCGSDSLRTSLANIAGAVVSPSSSTARCTLTQKKLPSSFRKKY